MIYRLYRNEADGLIRVLTDGSYEEFFSLKYATLTPPVIPLEQDLLFFIKPPHREEKT